MNGNDTPQPPLEIRPRRLNVLPTNPEERDPSSAVGRGRFPSWLHRRLPSGGELWATDKILSEHRLPTVCEEARCPNLLDCWSRKTATFLALGKQCTRSCGFCSIDWNASPPPLEPDEPQRIAASVKQLGLRHVVVTMVARDDLLDGGAAQMAAIVRQVRQEVPGIAIELLTSDFAGNRRAWDTVIASEPDVFNYNIETVRELTPRVRHKATYERTLELLSYLKGAQAQFKIKSGLMVGLGETPDQVKQTIDDLYRAGCAIITIGQYLQAHAKKLRVHSFVPPELFKIYADYGYSLGVSRMYCGPFVRSSYHAAEVAGEPHV